jgi:hypothetical protein
MGKGRSCAFTNVIMMQARWPQLGTRCCASTKGKHASANILK